MKRASEHQITKDDAEAGNLDEEAAPEGSFQKAPPEVLAKRRFLKARRSVPTSNSDTPRPNPFAALATNAPPEISPPAESAAENNSTELGKAKPDTVAPPATNEPAQKPEFNAKAAEVQNDSKNAASDSQTAAPAAEDAKEDAQQNSKPPEQAPELVQGVATNREQSADDAAVHYEPANGSVNPKASETQDEKHGDKQDGTPPEKQGGKQGGTAAEKEGERQDGTPVEKEVEKQDVMPAGKQGEKQDGTPAETKGEEQDESPSEKQSEKHNEKEAENEVTKDDGNAGEVPAFNANEIAPATTNRASEEAPAETSNGKTEEKAADAEGGQSKPKFEGKVGGTEIVPSKSLLAPASKVDTQDGGSKPNGASLNAPISFGNLSGSAPLTFANAAASDGGTFKFTPAPMPGPKSAPQKEFKEAKVETGEEDERELFRTRAKLYSLENLDSKPVWKERGVGILKLKFHKEKKTARLLMRTEATLRVILNTPVYAGMKFDRATGKSLRFQGFEEVDKEEKKTLTFLARFSSRDIASGLSDAVDNLESNKEDN